MKKVLVCLLVIFGVFGYFVFFNGQNIQNNNDYLRIHIRANSNLTVDQNIKYEVKNALVDELYDVVANADSKEGLILEIEKNKDNLEKVANNVLHKANTAYTAKISVNKEFFPTRVYNEDLTLTSGVYDALIVELGEAKGDNWWCIFYPPLCFMNVNYSKNTTYRSRIVEQIKKFFS